MLDPFAQAWRSHDHRKRENLQQELDQLFAALNRERKRSRIILTICGGYTLATTIAITIMFSRRQVSFYEVWPAVAAQALALLAIAWLIRTQFLGRRQIEMKTTSVKDALMSAQHSTQTGVRTLKLTAIAMASVLALSAVAMANLYSSGKMNERAISSLGAVFLLVAVFNGLILWVKWTRRLGPRRRRLDAILRDLNS